MTSAQMGRTEVLIGSIESVRAVICIHFVSESITNDPRMVSSARGSELDGDTLRYEMEMQTMKVSVSTPHIQIALYRIT